MARRTNADWLKLIEQQSNSNLSVAEFCKKNQLGQIYFYKQRSKLKKKAQASSFTKLRQPHVSTTSSASIKLQYHQSELNLPVSLSPTWLAELMKALA